MKCSELIKELEYWKRVSFNEDPEIVINTPPSSFEIKAIQPVKGVKYNRAIGLIFE